MVRNGSKVKIPGEKQEKVGKDFPTPKISVLLRILKRRKEGLFVSSQQEYQLVQQVAAAQKDSQAADHLIRQYQNFIFSQAKRFSPGATHSQQEEHQSIAMLAFYEALLGYQKHRGNFLSYAARTIRSRLIDHYRKEKRHRGTVSLELPAGDEDSERLMDTLPQEKDEIQSLTLRQASRQEIEEFGKQLDSFGLSFSQIAENCPKQQRTLTACQKVLSAARSHPETLEKLLKTKKLPMKELSALSQVEVKTMERHRSYLVAILLAFTNGYEIIRGHLYHLTRSQEVTP